MKLWTVTVRYRLKAKSYWSADVHHRVFAGSPQKAIGDAIRQTSRPKGKQIAEWAAAATDLGKNWLEREKTKP